MYFCKLSIRNIHACVSLACVCVGYYKDARFVINYSLLYKYNVPMHAPDYVTPACMLYVAAEPMLKPTTLLLSYL